MTDTAVAAEETPVEITELEKIEASRVDGVRNPANGTPILMMKALPEKPAAPAPVPVTASAAGSVVDVEALAAAVAKALGKPEKSKKRRAEKKPTVAKKATSGDTEIAGTGDLAEVVKAAVAEATKASEERVKALETQLAKVLAQPIPGGPVMSIATPPSGVQKLNDQAAKAAEYRDMADRMSDPETADAYRQLARKLEDAPATG